LLDSVAIRAEYSDQEEVHSNELKQPGRKVHSNELEQPDNQG
jgi:hemin uptake protein HemP